MLKKQTIIIIFCISVFFNISVLYATDYHGVCVGVSEYTTWPWPPLADDCTDDARHIKDALEDHQGWYSSQIKEILNAYATESYIKSKIQSKPRTSGNTNLFSFSGHGQSGVAGGMVTIDIKVITPGELQGWYGSSYNQYCAFIDCCHSGMFPFAMSNGVICSACTPTELSACGGPDGHSVYSGFVIRGIKNSTADDSDPGSIVSAEEVHTYAAPLTTNWAANVLYPPESMHPMMDDNYSGELDLKFIPIGVSISGPTTLNPGQSGTFTANPSNGTGTYTNYIWWKRNDGIQEVQNEDEWFEVEAWEGYQTIETSYSNNFSLKVRVYDSSNHYAEDTQSVIVTTGSIAYSRNEENILNENQSMIVKPKVFELSSNFPNPFNPTTKISYSLPEAQHVVLKVYDMQGRSVTTLVNGSQSAGIYNIEFDGAELSSGYYVYKIQTEKFSDTKKMLLLK